ncbi:hypothetical protein HJC23_010855 [Cyclotella cryptica]|uniref:peptidylprolyl isomerase n=1 Tax=Cyclotella cryptica TaxID=29204 RepID=A0ABD3QPK9_9STRA|eukprot:CCRYP_003621-RA/>CCRYP_003621-RA protein AED:0.41 eAED:0.41 QI:268/1/1/1/0.5/0.33/3/751/261
MVFSPSLIITALSCSHIVAFQAHSLRVPTRATAVSYLQRTSLLAKQGNEYDDIASIHNISRRSILFQSASAALLFNSVSSLANAEELREDNMYAPKFVQTYEDFTTTSEGWSYKDVKVGSDVGGGELRDGDRVVFDWSGYTIGYFGRPFEAKGGPQGGAFDKDINYFRATLGSKQLIPGLECALRTMKPGGVRQVIIPFGPLSYPADDKNHDLVGPKPTTFSGMRALNFVLENPRVDRTLLFNVKLIRVDRSDGKGGFIRG